MIKKIAIAVCGLSLFLFISGCAQQYTNPYMGHAPASTYPAYPIYPAPVQSGHVFPARQHQYQTIVGRNNGLSLSNNKRFAELFADRIYASETGGNPDNLVHWNVGEDFASLGIGHFTWYPVGRNARFGNTFPHLLQYLRDNGVSLPSWLLQAQGSPWQNRDQLLHEKSKNSGRLRELTDVLYQTKALQASYIIKRTVLALELLPMSAPPMHRALVSANIQRLLDSGYPGWYALVDYVNFKGEGLGGDVTSAGLLQVLTMMQPSPPGEAAVSAFRDAAWQVLQRRVAIRVGDRRYLQGWKGRIDGYLISMTEFR